MEQEEVERAALFGIGQRVYLKYPGNYAWRVVRRYWKDGQGIMYDIGDEAHTVPKEESRLTDKVDPEAHAWVRSILG